VLRNNGAIFRNHACFVKVKIALTSDQKNIDDYFMANSGKAFTNVRDTLLKDSQLADVYPSMSIELKTATSLASFDAALQKEPDLIDTIAPVARRLNTALPQP
jgi:hypothetical protein